MKNILLVFCIAIIFIGCGKDKPLSYKTDKNNEFFLQYQDTYWYGGHSSLGIVNLDSSSSKFYFKSFETETEQILNVDNEIWISVRNVHTQNGIIINRYKDSDFKLISDVRVDDVKHIHYNNDKIYFLKNDVIETINKADFTLESVVEIEEFGFRNYEFYEDKVVILSKENILSIHDIDSGILLGKIEVEHKVLSYKTNEDQLAIITEDEGYISLYIHNINDIENKFEVLFEETIELKNSVDQITAETFDGKILLSVNSKTFISDNLTLIKNDQQINPSDTNRNKSFRNPVSGHLYILSNDIVDVYNLETKELLKTFDNNSARSIFMLD